MRCPCFVISSARSMDPEDILLLETARGIYSAAVMQCVLCLPSELARVIALYAVRAVLETQELDPARRFVFASACRRLDVIDGRFVDSSCEALKKPGVCCFSNESVLLCPTGCGEAQFALCEVCSCRRADRPSYHLRLEAGACLHADALPATSDDCAEYFAHADETRTLVYNSARIGLWCWRERRYLWEKCFDVRSGRLSAVCALALTDQVVWITHHGEASLRASWVSLSDGASLGEENILLPSTPFLSLCRRLCDDRRVAMSFTIELGERTTTEVRLVCVFAS